ncbi:hypothetical protein GCM10010246_69530 [Streptomyces cuspidosporus]|uniref:Uncharacterized protein n=1 Tax=Streptomyces cuspidosporus TaxID=66882 RepID=A0ABN3H1M6_9ACTN
MAADLPNGARKARRCPGVPSRTALPGLVRYDRSVAPRRQAALTDGAARCDGPRCGSPDGRPDAWVRPAEFEANVGAAEVNVSHV